MNRSLLDTDVFSEILKDRNPQVAKVASRYRSTFGQFTISSITVMEVVKGFRRAGQFARLMAFLDHLPTEEVLPFDTAPAELAGKITADLHTKGKPIGIADPMIAAIAIRHGLVLVTANTSHFQRIQELGYSLELENWRQPRAQP